MHFAIIWGNVWPQSQLSQKHSPPYQRGPRPPSSSAIFWVRCQLSPIFLCRSSYKCKTVLEPVVEKFHKIMTGWKSKLLSKRGKLTLVQSTLWSIPVYFMYLFTILASISCQLEKIMRDFLWSNKDAEMWFHWVKMFALQSTKVG